MKHIFKSLLSLIICVHSGLNNITYASVVIGGTRLVYLEGQKQITVQLTNNSQMPALVQAWIDSGNPNISPEESRSPFIITPPIHRIEPSSGQALRIAFTGADLPSNQESLYWLNVLDIPPSPTVDANLLQMAIRSRIKIFFRPENLKGVADDAPSLLKWQLNQSTLQVENPTAFHVTLAHASTSVKGASLFSKSLMLKPKAVKQIPLKKSVYSDLKQSQKIHYISINDYGGRTHFDKAVRTTLDK